MGGSMFRIERVQKCANKGEKTFLRGGKSLIKLAITKGKKN
jgi:hypothetical protein